VLVDDLAAERGVKVDGVAGCDHRLHQRVRLRARQAPEEDRHREGGQLVVRHLLTGVTEHQLVPFLRQQRATVALALDQLGRPDHRSATNTVA
jgi:hypothetical protein